MSVVRCEPVNDALEIHYWTGERAGAPCECGKTRRPTTEERRRAKVENLHQWFASQPGARLERR